MLKVIFAIFLAAHGIIHLGYITPAPSDPNYPFRLNKSWLITSLGVPEPLVRLVGIALTIVVVVGFVLAGLASVGLIVPQGWWYALIIVPSIVSLALLVLFWHLWLVLGVVIDVALLVALVWLNWQPFAATTA